MRFKQSCMICKKATISGGSDIEASIPAQFRAFVKIAKQKGWHTINVENKKLEFICPFCNRRMLKALEKILIERD